ncbi:hypothetical protein ACKKBF_B38350 [Auxenochlorella protothecoides x Auxenochlorella symbiontica]
MALRSVLRIRQGLLSSLRILARPAADLAQLDAPALAKPDWQARQARQTISAQVPLPRLQHSLAGKEANRPEGSYHIQIVTGSVRGAGTPTPALLQLFGEDGESEPYLIGSDGSTMGFESSSRKTYVVQAPHLGQLNRVLIRQLPLDAADEEAGASSGWFLERIVVVGPEGDSWTFPCAEWLGRDHVTQAIGSPERVLVPLTVHLSSMMDPRYNLKSQMSVAASAFSIPHPEKVAEGVRGVNRRGAGHGGEDAYFITHASETGVVGLGVSDGVYAWRERGVDAGAYSRGLMAGCAAAVAGGAADALGALRSAARAVAEVHTLGSATACVVLVNAAGGVMSAANLGDSGWMLLGGGGGGGGGPGARRRPRALRARSPQQEHSFGYPFQLGAQPSADSPEDAMLTSLPVGPGCSLVLGSDGLFDNLDDEAIVALVNHELDAGGTVSAVARRLAYAAFEASQDRARDTPYSRGATEAFDMIYRGGKADDITALVAVVS